VKGSQDPRLGLGLVLGLDL